MPSFRRNNATRAALRDIVLDAFREEDEARSAWLNWKLGVCDECGKWALKHHSYCSHKDDLIDVRRQQRILAENQGIDIYTGDGDE